MQPGDTVWGIAQKLGMDPMQYMQFLREHYGPEADLNDIQIGRRLPLPQDLAAPP